MNRVIGELDRLARSLGAASATRGAPERTPLHVLDGVLQALVGHKLMTVLKIDAAQQWSTRVYSSQPEHFATQRRKSLCDAPQMQKAIAAGAPVLVDGADPVRAAFPDHARIMSLGCASVLTIPIRIGHHAVANVNLLHAADHYPPVDSDAMSLANIACQMVGGWIVLER